MTGICTVTGPLYGPDGTLLRNKAFKIYRLGGIVSAAAKAIVPDVVSVTTDADGDFSQALVLGPHELRYKTGSATHVAQFNVPDEASISLQELLASAVAGVPLAGYFETLAAFTAAVGNGFTARNGAVVAVGGFLYLRDTTKTGETPAGWVRTGKLPETLESKTIDADSNTVSNLEMDNLKASAKTGSDARAVTGTAGTANNFVQWNADGDAVDSGKAKPAGAVVGTDDTQTLTNKTFDLGNNTLQSTAAQLNAAVSDARVPISWTSRAALKTWWDALPTATKTNLNGTILSGGTVQYIVKDNATAISDLPGLVPYGDVSDDHFDGDKDAAAAFLSSQRNPVLIENGSFTYAEADQVDLANLWLEGEGEASLQHHRQVILPNAPTYVPPLVRIKADPTRVVLVGDSISTRNANHTSAADMLTTQIEDFCRRNGTQEFYNRAIGGENLAAFIAAAPGAGSQPATDWWTDGTRSWRNYVEDLRPTLVFVSFGMNDRDTIDDAHVEELKTWADSFGIQLVMCTNFLPSLANGGALDPFEAQDSRDAAAGFVRSWAHRENIPCLDMHREFVAARDGIDMWSSTILTTNETPAKVGTSIDSTYSVINFAAEVTLDVSAFTTGDVTLQSVRVKIGYGDNDGLWFSKNSFGDLLLSLRTGATTPFNTYDSTVIGAFPSVDTTYHIVVSRGLVQVFEGPATATGGTVPPIYSRKIWRFGGFFTPRVYEGSSFGGLTSARFYRDRSYQYKPTITDRDLYGGGDGNGSTFNHPGNYSGTYVIEPVLRNAVIEAPDAVELTVANTGAATTAFLDTATPPGTGLQLVIPFADSVVTAATFIIPRDIRAETLTVRFVEPAAAPSGRRVIFTIYATRMASGSAPASTLLRNALSDIPATTAGQVGSVTIDITDHDFRRGDQLFIARQGALANDTWNATFNVVGAALQ